MQIHYRKLLSRLEKLKIDTRQLNNGGTHSSPFFALNANSTVGLMNKITIKGGNNYDNFIRVIRVSYSNGIIFPA